MTDDDRSGYRLFNAYLEQKQELANARVDPSLTEGSGARLVKMADRSIAATAIFAGAICVLVGIGAFPRWATLPLVTGLILSITTAAYALTRLNNLPN